MAKEKPLPPTQNGWVGQIRKRNVRISPEDLEKIRKTYFVEKVESQESKCECVVG